MAQTKTAAKSPTKNSAKTPAKSVAKKPTAKGATAKKKSPTAAKPAAKKSPSKTAVAKKSTAAAAKAKATDAVDRDSEALDSQVKLDRRRKNRRDETAAASESKAKGEAKVGENADKPAAPALERREKVNRRRQIDPTTCERDYSDAEVEFMNAMDEYKRKNGRMFPTCSEVLEVIRDLGYAKLTPAEQAAREAVRAAEETDAVSEEASLEDRAEQEALAVLEESETLRVE